MSFVYVTRRASISSAHRLYNPTLSPEENKELYGKCVDLHGHNYTVEITWRGPIQPTGMAIDLRLAKRVIEERVAGPLDHRLLDDLEYFKGRPSTTENLCMFVYAQLSQIDYGTAVLWRVKISETDNNVFEYIAATL